MRYLIESRSNRPYRSERNTGVAPPRAHWAALALAVTWLLQAGGADAQFHTKGRWIGPDTLGLEGTHLIVMRDVADDTTKILLLGGNLSGIGHKLWCFRASDSLSRPVLSGAGANLIELGPPELGANLFCSGHATLGDGRGIIIGGEFPGPSGTELAYVVDPRFPDGASQAWTKQATMAQERWYPNATTLGDGSILATAGTNHTTMLTFGGTTGTPYGELRPLKLAGAAWWGIDSVPRVVGPSARSGHSALFPLQGNMVLFGGDDNGGSGDGKRRDVWLASRIGDDSTWAWHEPPAQGDPSTGNLPARRSQHTAVPYAANDSMIVFGGQDSSGQALADVWVGRYVNQIWRWYSIAVSGGPGPRYGHTAVLDPGPPNSTDGSRLLVFGGRESSGTVANNSVWAFFPPTAARSARWSQVSVSGGSSPLSRTGHVALFDNKPRGDPPKMRMIVFGGQGADSLMNNIWELSRSDVAPGDTVYTWNQLQPSRGPTPRSDAAAAFDQSDRIDLLGGSTGAGYTGETWAFRLAPQFQANPDSMWILLPMRASQFHAPPPARAGLSVVFDGYTPTSRYPERFNPAPAGSPPGAWSTIDAPQKQFSYSFTFLLPNGKLFYGGPSTEPYQYVLDLVTGWGGSQYVDADLAGSAVMYRPGRILRCGRLGYSHGVTGTSRTDTIAFVPPDWTDSGWQPVTAAPPLAPPLAPRANPNLTMLPTGDVLVTGGTNGHSPEKRPQTWSVNTASWTSAGSLSEDPAIRNYHSAAALLPCARILSTGGDLKEGDLSNPNALKATIFEPPYLFNTSDGYATRPQISLVPRRLRYGAQFSICMSSSDSISSVCLIRPAAVTHAFDQNQRYVPLTFTPVGLPTSRLTVTAPADSFRAPSGDYMLFIVNKRGVPSIARWTRMGASWSEGDVTRPARITDLTTDFRSSSSISLYWTAVGDDSVTGIASYADLRRSTSPIDSENFGSALAVNPQPVPVCPGTLQYHNVTGLAPGTTYYFAIKFSDESGNASLISTTVSATTLSGGCCQGERAVVANEEGTSAGRSADKARPTISSTVQATSSSATSSGGTPLALEVIPNAGGLDLRLLAVGGGTFEGQPLPGGGVLLQKPDGAGGWTTDLEYELPPGSRYALPAPARPTRWLILDPLVLETVPLEVSGSAAGWLLEQAHHSRQGDLTDTLDARAGAAPAMTAGDTLTARYQSSPESAGAPGSLLVIQRPSSASGSTRASGRRPESGTGFPQPFALLQNQPNPFAEFTTIRFALPAASRVRLEVYDLLGRRVRTLASAAYPAGEHEVEWNRRTTAGALASPGLYFYRIEAGEHREKMRMVILP